MIDVAPLWILFNWNSSVTKDAGQCALNLGSYDAETGFTAINQPEYWFNLPADQQRPAAYSIADVGTGTVTIHAQFHAVRNLALRGMQPYPVPYQGKVLVGAVSDGNGDTATNILGWIAPKVLEFNANGYSEMVEFELKHHNIGKGGVFGVRAASQCWQWAAAPATGQSAADPAVDDEDSLNKFPYFIANMTEHQVFVLADRPRSPWSEYPPDDQLFRLPCVQLLEPMLKGLTKPKDLSGGNVQTWVVSAIAQWLHPSGPVNLGTGLIETPMRYSYASGEGGLENDTSSDSQNPIDSFLSVSGLAYRFSREPGAWPPFKECSCFTPSLVLCAMARLLGCATSLMRFMDGANDTAPQGGVRCHPLVPIASGWWVTGRWQTQPPAVPVDDPDSVVKDPYFQEKVTADVVVNFGQHRIVAIGDFEGTHDEPDFCPFVVDATFRANARIDLKNDGTGGWAWAPALPTPDAPWDAGTKKRYLSLPLQGGALVLPVAKGTKTPNGTAIWNPWAGYRDFVLHDPAQPIHTVFDTLKLMY